MTIQKARAWAAGVIVALLLASCGGGAPPPDTFYRLPDNPPPAAADTIPGTLEVQPVRADGLLNDRAVVYSDAPDWDGFWLYRLFAAAGVKQGFSLVNFADLFDGLGAAELQALLARASRTSPHRHRAREDVLHMRRVYELAKDAAA